MGSKKKSFKVNLQDGNLIIEIYDNVISSNVFKKYEKVLENYLQGDKQVSGCLFVIEDGVEAGFLLLQHILSVAKSLGLKDRVKVRVSEDVETCTRFLEPVWSLYVEKEASQVNG